MGRIFEGRELGWTLDSHVATFRSITSVPAELTQNGVEPPLSIEARSMLLLHSPQRAHQRLSPCRGEPGADRAPLRTG